MDKCEAERNPITLVGLKALGEAHLKCCMQMHYSLALTTKGSVRTLVRSVEESSAAEAWRLIHSRYGSRHSESTVCFDAEGSRCLRNSGVGRAEGFRIRLESLGAGCRRIGTCVRNCFGRCSQLHSDDEYGTDFSEEQLAVGYILKQCRSSQSFVAMVLLFPKLWSKPDSVSLKWNRRG